MDNLSFTYGVLATVSVQQPFYSNNVCRKFEVDPALDFELQPTDECAQAMRRLDVLFRLHDRRGGFVLLARQLGKNAGGQDLLRFPAAKADKLTFWMRVRNPDVMNFDDVPAAFDPASMYYFTNQRSDGTSSRDNLHLTDAAAGASGASDRIARSGESYRFHHPAAVAPGNAKVRHLLTGMEVDTASIVVQAGESDLAFDLRALPLGKCRLTIGATIEDEFYYVGVFAPQAFGVIELVLDSALAANYRIVEADRSLTADRPAYSILLPNRRTRWRYTVHLQPTSALAVEMAALSAADKAIFLDGLRIVTNDSAVTFTRDPASDTDIVFVSDTDLALKERYVSSITSDPLSLTLKKNVGAVNETVVRSDLPYPHALIDARAAPVIFSDTFLTL